MFRHYLIIALRNAWKYRGYTFINLFGLATGIACCLMIVLYVQDELSYDRFHQHADRIYRLNEYIEDNEVGERSASLPFPTARAIETDFPGLVEAAVRLFNFQAPTLTLAHPDDPARKFNEPRVFFADSGFFRVFDFELLAGNPETVLADPYSLLLTEEMAAKYFPGEDPIGKSLLFQGETELVVRGLLAQPPAQSHVQFDFLISFTTLYPLYQDEGGWPFKNWYWNPCWTYVLLADEGAKAELEAQLPGFIDKYFHPAIRDDVSLHLQPLKDIHLYSQLDYEIAPNSDADSIYILSGIALFILLIAAINYMNLATARAVKRAREVGMRKAIGVARPQLVFQFLVESLLFALAGIGLAVVMVELFLPGFNQMAGKGIGGDFWYQPEMLLSLLVVVAVVGLGAGLYPALVLTAFEPASVLKGTYLRPRGLTLRKALVVLQFAIAIVLMVGTGVALSQLRLLQKDDPGFQREHIIMLPVQRTGIGEQYEAFRSELLGHRGIEAVTALEEVLGAKYQAANYWFEGMPDRRSRLFPHLNVRHDFLETFDIELLAGRPFRREFPTDDTSALIVNEALVRHLGWRSPADAVGKQFYAGPGGKVIGVVKDFNFADKRQPIGPLVLDLNVSPRAFNLFLKYVAVRVDPAQLKPVLKAMEKNWETFVPDKAFEYFFLDQNLRNLYLAEARMTFVASTFAALATLVAILGLLGLVSFAAEQRRKELSVRKVMGASGSQLVGLLSWEFLQLVLLAFVLAVPVAWWLLHRWLENFAYRVKIQPGWFVLAGGIALALALLTVGTQAWRAARSNPVEALRHE